MDTVDLLVIGGGINGAGLARDAAGRGLSVMLAEKDDLGQGTSSRSGKYIHGGLRYLEYYEFRLVREALIEREVVLKAAPQFTWPLRLVLVHSPAQRPRWLIRLGLFLYDNLGGRKRVPGTKAVRLDQAPEGDVVRDAYTHAFAYHDVWVDDARLVVLNALDAARHGARVFPRTRVASARRDGAEWLATLEGPDGPQDIRARAIINTAGPWVEQVLGNVAGVNSSKHIRLVKGSHIVTKRWWKGNHGYVLQAPDKRLIFVNPFQDDLALFGTTDIPFDGAPETAEIGQDEVNYLLDILETYFKNAPKADDILWTYSGVRPLFDDDEAKGASAVTRDYTFELDGGGDRAPILTAFGGKLTTYRKLSEAALAQLAPHFPKMGKPWTENAPLPGGDMPGADFNAWFSGFRDRWPWLPEPLALHLARAYGTEADQLLQGAGKLSDMGQHLGCNFYAREAEWLCTQEWAVNAEDLLFRRTKHGVFLSDDERAKVATWLESRST
ncbi:glycerol-3-phosphate dehydrogenase [Arenibacterium sp. CAU 1754]